MSLSTRLTWDAPDVAARISGANGEQQRQIALAVVEYAFDKSPYKEDSHVVLRTLREGEFGDGSFRQWLEDQWLDAEQRSDKAAAAGDNPTGYGHALHARALAASYQAVLADPEEAALEAVYETYDESRQADVNAIIDRILGSA